MAAKGHLALGFSEVSGVRSPTAASKSIFPLGSRRTTLSAKAVRPPVPGTSARLQPRGDGRAERPPDSLAPSPGAGGPLSDGGARLLHRQRLDEAGARAPPPQRQAKRGPGASREQRQQRGQQRGHLRAGAQHREPRAA